MAIFFVTLFLVVVCALAVLVLVAGEASGRAASDQQQFSRFRSVMRHLNGDARPPQAIESLLRRTPDEDAGAGQRTADQLPASVMEEPSADRSVVPSTPDAETARLSRGASRVNRKQPSSARARVSEIVADTDEGEHLAA